MGISNKLKEKGNDIDKRKNETIIRILLFQPCHIVRKEYIKNHE